MNDVERRAVVAAKLVHRLKPRTNVEHDPKYGLRREGDVALLSHGNELPERRSLDVVHHQQELVSRLVQIEHRHDVGMVKA